MSRPSKILVAFDGSRHSKQALEWAVDLSLLSGASVTIVKVEEPVKVHRANELYDAGYWASLAEQVTEIRKADEKLLVNAVETAKGKGVTAKAELLQGNIAATLIEYAQNNAIDLIVAGTKGHGMLEELLIGSVTRNLVSLSPVPVLVVKNI